MILRKFTVVSVERKKELTKFISLGSMKPKPRREQMLRFSYIITGDDEKIYHCNYYRKPRRIVAGQVIRCFVQGRTDNSFNVAYHPLCKKDMILTPYSFEKAIKNYIERNQKSIAFHQGEIERLKSLRKVNY